MLATSYQLEIYNITYYIDVNDVPEGIETEQVYIGDQEQWVLMDWRDAEKLEEINEREVF